MAKGANSQVFVKEEVQKLKERVRGIVEIDSIKEQALEKALLKSQEMEKVFYHNQQAGLINIAGIGATIKVSSIDAVSEVVTTANESYFIIYVNGNQIKVSADNEVDAQALLIAFQQAWSNALSSETQTSTKA